ncbi:uncharacterized protein [Argopecten irradians]|uniref:uncharacterized protein isoform X2 n=1 Tax=Argopecten irradians TaxID=31199 RepID=UPI003724B06B
MSIDSDGNGYLTMKDLTVLIKKIIEFTGWNEESAVIKELFEVHVAFFETLQEKKVTKKDQIERSDWMSLWQHILPGSMGMQNFPVWLRLLPRFLFRVIDTKNDRLLDTEEIKQFYVTFLKALPEAVDDLSVSAFNEMTDYGRYPLTLEGYEQMFANFLLGRTKYGPGRHIFGCFKHSAEEKTGLISWPSKEEPIIEITPKILLRTTDAIRSPMVSYRKE